MLSSFNFMLLDAARLDEKIEEAKSINDFYLSLYKGRSEEALAAVAPFFFTIPEDPEFMHWYEKNVWGNGAGVLISSRSAFADCYKHFRNFLIVKSIDDKALYFRFYDPRVLKIFLPTCNKEQIIEFFGPVDLFVVEGDDKDHALLYQQIDGSLHIEEITAMEVFTSPKIKKHSNF